MSMLSLFTNLVNALYSAPGLKLPVRLVRLWPDHFLGKLQKLFMVLPGLLLLYTSAYLYRVVLWLNNYRVLQTLWEKAEQITHDSEFWTRIIGVEHQMSTFNFVFGVVLGE